MKENDQSLLQNSLLSRSSESQKSLIEVPLISTEEEFVKTNSTYPKKPDKPGEANQKTELNRSRKQDANNPKPSEDEKDGTKTRELRFEAKSKDEGHPVPQNESPTLRLRMLLGRKPFSAENSDVSDHEDGKRVDRNQNSAGNTSRAKSAVDVVRAVEKLKKKVRKRKDDEELAQERENREKYLRNADNLKRAHAVMRETFMDLLSDKVERDREEIQERTDKWEEKMRQMEANRQKERRSKVPKKNKVEVTHDQEYLDNVPKSRIYQVLQLKEEYRKEGKLKHTSDEDRFWEEIKSGRNPIDREIKQKIQNKRLQIDQSAVSVVPPSEASAGEVVINQSADNSEEEEEEQEQEVKPKGGSSILLDLMEGKNKPNSKVSAVGAPNDQTKKKSAEEKPREEQIANQLPNLLNIPQFTKRGKSAVRVDGKDQQNQLSSSRRDHLQAPSPDPISNLFRRPEMPKLKSLESAVEQESVWEREQQVHLEEHHRHLRDKQRHRQKKQVQIMYQNAITHMAFTNRLMTRGGFSDHANVIGSTVRDLVEQEREGAADIRIPHSPVPRLEPARTMDGHGMYTHSHGKLVPLETREYSDLRPYKDKQYDKPSSTKSVDRRRLKKSASKSASGVGITTGGGDLEPFRGEGDATAALSMQAIIPTSVVKQPRWHRSMWTNYNHIGVNNPDEQSQKWEQHMSKLGRELANQSSPAGDHNSVVNYSSNGTHNKLSDDGYEIATSIISSYNLPPSKTSNADVVSNGIRMPPAVATN
ncbi:uncharacterized protein LOC142341576 isoform X2 [Convolutriloba macropyga]|uniref:uncharacterized protein LOC142341576 isoform X2 n=1 Tax=Convolutriloba macropyga TaxID=536237 RepID=UPI003F520DB5